MAFQINPSSSPVVSSADHVSSAPVEAESHVAVFALRPQGADTVKLSLAARVHQLHTQGQSASQISNNLGLSAQVVSSYLGGVPVKAVAVAAPAQAETAEPAVAAPAPVRPAK